MTIAIVLTVMGENIGTTVTSNLAALTASTQARRAAFAHMFFNVFGVCWMMIVFHPFVNAICSVADSDMSVVVSDRTVDVHITRLRKKLGPYAVNIVSRQGFGYVFEE